MKKNLVVIVALFSIAISFAACGKETTNGNNNAGAGVGSGTISWVEGNAGIGTPIVADSAYVNNQFKTIYAFKGSGSNKYIIEINLTALAAGAYSLASPTTNMVSYIRNGGAVSVATAGSVTIATNINNLLTGSVVASMPSLSDRLYITMNNVPVR
jgi:hypothetical protein